VVQRNTVWQRNQLIVVIFVDANDLGHAAGGVRFFQRPLDALFLGLLDLLTRRMANREV